MRAKVQARLRKIKDRLAGLTRAEQFRHGRSLYWKNVYHARRRRFGEDDERTMWALHKFRTSRELGWKIDKTQAVLHRRAERKLDWLRKHKPPLDPDGDGLITIDGKQVATEVGKEVLRIRNAGRWKGYVVSGYRLPAPPSTASICVTACAAVPSVPARAPAGRRTTHGRVAATARST